MTISSALLVLHFALCIVHCDHWQCIAHVTFLWLDIKLNKAAARSMSASRL